MSFQGSSAARQLRRAVPAAGICLALAIAAALSVERFASPGNLLNVVSQVAPLALATLGQTLVILVAGIDLSVGPTLSLVTTVLATVPAETTLETLLLTVGALAVGAAVGFFNGVGKVFLNIHPLIMTFASGAIIEGIALWILPQPGGAVPYSLAGWLNTRWSYFSMAAFVVLLAYGLALFFLHFTRYGRHVYAAGRDPQRAYLNGVPTARIELVNYTLSGVLAAAAGVMMAVRIYSGDPVIGASYSMDSIAAVVIGGTSLFGGIGGLLGSLAGAVLLGLLSNIMNLVGVFSYYQYALRGAILIVAVVLAYMGAERS